MRWIRWQSVLQLQRRSLFFAVIGVTWAVTVLADIRAATAAPQIKSLSLRGLQIGKPTTLIIEGDDLLPDPRIMLNVRGEQQSVLPNATAQKIEIEIEVPAETPAGLQLLRVVTADGLSNGLAVGIDALPQVALSEKIAALPVAVSGRVTGDQVVRTSFAGTRGQTVMVEVEARRLLSDLNPVIRLYDARQVQLAWAQGGRSLQGDARLQTVLPADGEYTVELHDALFQGRGAGDFRLKIGEWSFADLAYPPAMNVASSVEFLSTNIPAGEISIASRSTPGTYFAVPWPRGLRNASGPPPIALSTDVLEEIETTIRGGALQKFTVPVGVSGRLLTEPDADPKDAVGENKDTATGNSATIRKSGEDRYHIGVTPGDKLRIEVHAQRIGSPLDAVLTIYDETGKKVLMANDDRPGISDPAIDFTVPANAKAIVVGINDLLGRTGSDFVYHIAIAPQETRGISLSIIDDRIAVPHDGVAILRVTADRKGYSGPIDLEVSGVGGTIWASNTRIMAGSKVGLVTLMAKPGQWSTGHIKIHGATSSETAANPVATEQVAKALPGLFSPVLLPADALSTRQPWMRQEIAVAVTRRTPISLVWEEPDAALPLGAKLVIQPTVVRADDEAGQVRLSLLTNQQPPQKTIKENNKDKQVDDLDRAIRLDGMPTIAADKTAGTASIIVPADLPDANYQLALRGELLSADKKRVVATVYTPVLNFKTTRPVRLELTGEPKINAPAGEGETGKLIGKIVRQPGFNEPVRVTLLGLAKGVPAPIEDVPADRSDFELSVRLPFGTKPGALKDIKIHAVAGANTSDPNAVRTNSVPVAVNVVAGKKPVVEKPLAIFEDDPQFAESLNEGGGQARIESAEKYSGTGSLRVTPDQKFNSALSGLGVKIRKEPGAAEYRYVRFAWKKKGGQQLCLQFNHDGVWGPPANNPQLKFRYHAGPGECFGGSVAVDNKVPDKLTIVTRDLYADFGEFTLNGLAFAPIDGEFALFDHIYLGRAIEDLDSVKEDGK